MAGKQISKANFYDRLAQLGLGWIEGDAFDAAFERFKELSAGQRATITEIELDIGVAETSVVDLVALEVQADAYKKLLSGWPRDTAAGWAVTEASRARFIRPREAGVTHALALEKAFDAVFRPQGQGLVGHVQRAAGAMEGPIAFAIAASVVGCRGSLRTRGEVLKTIAAAIGTADAKVQQTLKGVRPVSKRGPILDEILNFGLVSNTGGSYWQLQLRGTATLQAFRAKFPTFDYVIAHGSPGLHGDSLLARGLRAQEELHVLERRGMR